MMSKAEYRAIFEQLGLTQREMAEWLGVKRLTLNRWAKDGVTSPPAAKLLRLTMALKLPPESVDKACQVVEDYYRGK
jgi:transcriptional regulator with XRE-family HTH domain